MIDQTNAQETLVEAVPEVRLTFLVDDTEISPGAPTKAEFGNNAFRIEFGDNLELCYASTQSFSPNKPFQIDGEFTFCSYGTKPVDLKIGRGQLYISKHELLCNLECELVLFQPFNGKELKIIGDIILSRKNLSST